MAVKVQKVNVGGRAKVKIIQDCLVGGEHCARGAVVEVSEEDSVVLINMGRAEELSDSGKDSGGSDQS